MTLESMFEEHIPISRYRLECNECGALLHDTAPEQPTMQTSSYFRFLTVANATKHRENTGHLDLALSLRPRRVVENIDVTVTVGNDE